VDAGQDPSRQKRVMRSLRENEAAARVAEKEEERRLEDAAKAEDSNTLRKLLAVADGDEPAGLYTNKLKMNKAGAGERGMLMQAWSDILDTPLTRITPQEISKINLARLKDPEADDDDDSDARKLLAASTLDRYNTTGHAFFVWAIDNNLCTNNPFSKEPRYAGGYDYNGDFRYLSPEEAKHLVATAERMTTAGELKIM
jgi:hypothetical protein